MYKSEFKFSIYFTPKENFGFLNDDGIFFKFAFE